MSEHPEYARIPVPDPTRLTTDAVNAATDQWRRELAAVRELLESRIDGMKEIIETRLEAMDEATKLLATNVDKVPYAILQEAGNLKALIMSHINEVGHVSDQRFTAVQAQFDSNALALNAALSAQKEAAAEQNKSNTLAIDRANSATKETIAANASQTANSLASLVATMADLKDRLVRLEAGGVATTTARGEQRLDTGQRLVMISVGLSALGIIIGVLVTLAVHH